MGTNTMHSNYIQSLKQDIRTEMEERRRTNPKVRIMIITNWGFSLKNKNEMKMKWNSSDSIYTLDQVLFRNSGCVFATGFFLSVFICFCCLSPPPTPLPLHLSADRTSYKEWPSNSRLPILLGVLRVWFVFVSPLSFRWIRVMVNICHV